MTIKYYTITTEGASIPESAFRDKNVHKIEVLRQLPNRDPWTIYYHRLTSIPTYKQYMNPHIFVLELRLCHTWSIEYTYKNVPTQQYLDIPVNDNIYTIKQLVKSYCNKHIP